MLSSSADFSIFNTGWNGTSELAVSTFRAGKFSPSFELRSTGGDVEFIRIGLEDMELDPALDAVAVIGPTESYSAAEGAIIGDFVRAGGNLLVADDFGSANSLLESMGAGCRISAKLIIDLSFEKSPEFPVCFDVVPDALTTNVTSLQLNYASSIIMGGASEPIVRTSFASWSDTDGDRMQDFGEPTGPFVVLAKEYLGQGEIILLSDPSVLINGMRDHLDNEVLSSNLVSVVSEGRSGLYFDESHRDYFDPITISTELTGTISGNVKAAIFATAFFLALWIATDFVDRALSWARNGVTDTARFIVRKVLRRSDGLLEHDGLTVDELVAELKELHPDWREGLVRFVINEKQRHEAHVEGKS